MRIAIGAGHSPNCDGATGHGYSENHEARLICDAFEAICKRKGVPFVRCDSSASTQAAYLNEQVSKYNSAACDYSLQVHLNSGGGTGCEVWRKSAPYDTAADISAKMAATLGLRDRGAKYSENLRILNSVRYRPYIIEVCFIDSWNDIQALQNKHAAVAAAIFEAVTGQEAGEDMEFRVESPILIRTGQSVAYRVSPIARFNYAWAKGEGWEDWGSTIKETGEATHATTGVFTPKEPGTYRLWVDVIDQNGESVTTQSVHVTVADDAPMNDAASVAIDIDAIANAVASKFAVRLQD